MLGFGVSSRSIPGAPARGDARVTPPRTAEFDGGLDLLADAVFIVGCDGIVLAARLGLSGDPLLEARSVTLVGAHVGDVLGPDATTVVMAAVREALDTGEVVARAWESGTGAEGTRSYRQGTFRCQPGLDSVLAISRDVTGERCRSDADRLVLDLGRRLIAGTTADLEEAAADALRETASFVGGRGALLLVPDDSGPRDFTIASLWAPTRVSPEMPTNESGKPSWFASYVQDLEEPVVLAADAVPLEAAAVRSIVREYGFAAIGLIPTVSESGRLGVVAIGFPTCPDRVSRLRLGALGPLGHLLSAVSQRHRRETERWVREAEDEFRAMVRQSADITVVMNEQGRLLFVSSSAQELLGFEPDELVGQNAFEFLHPDDHAEATGSLASLGSGSTEGGRAFRIRHRDGSWLTFEGIITDHRGDPTIGGFIAVARDVTGRLAVEAALGQSEQRFRQLAERASDMIYRFALEPEPRLEYMSPAARSITGYTPEELYADPSLMFGRIHADDRPTALAQFTDPKSARQFRLRSQHRDGTWGWTEHRIVPVFDETGHLVCVEGVARDVTEQVRAESQLLESNQLSGSVMESIPGPTIVLDQSGTIIMANEAWPSYLISTGATDPGVLGIGANYLAACDAAAAGQDVEGAAGVAAGIRACLSGAEETFQLDYSPPGLPKGRWFMMRVSRLRSDDGGVVVLHTDITERKRYERELGRRALHDPLTGLPNRALLMDRLEGAIDRAGRHSSSIGVLVVDLDRFKSVNDALGHATGDRVLVAIAARMSALARPGDTIARWGGDEFVILCEGLRSRHEAADIADRVITAFGEPFSAGATDQVVVTASIGIVLDDHGAQANALLRDADAAMYLAKQLGRDRYEFFDQQLRAETLSRLLIESELRTALEQDQFRLFYQPVVELKTGVITGVEALVRWQHPTRGLLAPDQFLAVAEESSLIVPIGDWVLREACRQHQAWELSYPERPPIPIAVNVSGQQLRRPGFVDEVFAALRETGVMPEALSFELTETALMEHAAGPNASRLHDAGLRLAVDDFGIAYSSLSYLKRFPVSMVKIDKSFIAGLPHNPEDAAIVQAIIGMTDALGLVTIAEGVERRDQRDHLLALGCQQAQGHLYAPAGPPSVIDDLIRNGSIQPRGGRSPFSSRRRPRQRAARQPN